MTRHYQKQGLQYFEIASVTVEDNGEQHTMNFCKDCYSLREGERKEPAINNKRWKRLVVEMRSRGMLATGLGARSLENKIMEIYAATKVYAKNLLKEVSEVMSLGKEWLNETPQGGLGG